MTVKQEKMGVEQYNREAIETVTPYVDKMRREDLDYILGTYREDFEAGNQAMAAYVAQTLGLETLINVKTKEVESKDDVKSDGQYWNHSKEITLFQVKGEKVSLSKTIDTIAHELWHAKQWEEVENGDKRGALYKEEFTHAVDPYEDYEGYRNQMVEQEAFIFGQSVAERAGATARMRMKDEQVVSKGIGSRLKSILGFGGKAA